MTNVLIVVLDDARRDILATMPNVAGLQKRGTTFTKAVAETPVCHPIRANLFVGQSAARTDIVSGVVLHNEVDDAVTAGRWSYDAWFPTWLSHDSACVGKVMNASAAITPAGWSRFRQSQAAGAHFVTNVNEGQGAGYESITETWHLDWARAEMEAHIAQSGFPWLIWYGSSSPHTPHAAVTDDVHKFSWVRAPAEPQEGTNWPSWVTDQDKVTPSDATPVRRAMIREAWETDRMLGQVLESVDLDHTIVVVTSDNGAHHGDHRIVGTAQKNTIYEAAYGVPLVVAGPGFPERRAVTAPVTLHDIIYTVTAVDEATAPHPIDGADLRRIANHPGDYEGRALLGRRRPVVSDTFPATDWVYTGTRKLARHYQHNGGVDPTGEVYEMYDLDTDPDETINVAEVAERESERDDLEAHLDALLDQPAGVST